MQRPSSPPPPELVAMLAQRRRPPGGWRTERPRHLPAALFEPPRLCIFLVDGKPVQPPPLYRRPDNLRFISRTSE